MKKVSLFVNIKVSQQNQPIEGVYSQMLNDRDEILDFFSIMLSSDTGDIICSNHHSGAM